MARDETCGNVDLPLPVEGVEQSDTDLLRIGGQIVEHVAAVARNAGWRHIEIAGEVERHRSVQDATHRLDVALPLRRPDPL